MSDRSFSTSGSSLGNIGNIASTTTASRFVEMKGAASEIASRFAGHMRYFMYYLQSIARELLPNEAVSYCRRRVVPAAPAVPIHYTVTEVENRPRHTVYARNLMSCHSVWHCPVCAYKITSARRQDLELAVSRGRHLALVTYTFAHNDQDNLNRLLAALLESYRKMKSGRAWDTLRTNHDMLGGVRTLEVTYGQHGFHPHLHELVFLNSPVDEGKLQADLFARWETKLKEFRRSASAIHGVHVTAADSAVADYVAKYGHDPVEDWSPNWRISQEITGAMAKISRLDGLSMWEILAANGYWFEQGVDDGITGPVFIEYARAFKGRNQMTWSNGLREMLELPPVVNESSIGEGSPDDPFWGAIRRQDWVIIVNSGPAGTSGIPYFFRMVELALDERNPAIVFEYLRDLGITPMLSSGEDSEE